MIRNLMILVATLASSSFAIADDAPPAYSVPVSHLQGNLACTIDMVAMAFDCNAHVAGKGQTLINMHVTDKDAAGNPTGFSGVDRVSEAGTNYTVIVEADAKQQMKGISLVTDAVNGATFNASFMSSPTTSLQVLNLSPLSVDMSNSAAVKVNLAFTLYAPPMSSIMQATRNEDIVQLVLARIRPYLLSLKAK